MTQNDGNRNSKLLYEHNVSAFSENMRFIKTVLFAAIISFGSLNSAHGQEFNCSVAVNYQSLSGSDYSFLDELEDRVREYVNMRQWTQDRFEEEERIDCSMTIVFTEATSLTRFRARLVLASRRPIYGSAQQTTVLQVSDDSWTFDYSQGTPLIYEPDRYHPLTSVINFYAYLMLGYDYDTFAELGGQPLFEEARRVAEIAGAGGAAGWATLSGDQSRGELIGQIMDPRFKILRTAYFNYHYGVLDHFTRDTSEARSTLLTIVQDLESLREDVSRAYYLDQFFAAKYSEIAAVFKSSPEANPAFDALSKIDPAHLSDYTMMTN